MRTTEINAARNRAKHNGDLIFRIPAGVEMDMQTRLTLSRFEGAAEPPLIDETVGQRLLKTAARFPDREALVVLEHQIRRVAAHHAAIER